MRYDGTTNGFSKQVRRRFLNYRTYGDIDEANAFALIQQGLSSGKWVVDVGVRYDYFHFSYTQKINLPQQPSQSASIISPELNIQYTVNPNVQLYTKLGKGFRSNNTRVVVANEGREILPQ